MHILYVQQMLVLPGARGNDRCWAFAKSWVDAGHQVSFLTSTAGFTKDKTAEFQEKSTRHYIFQGIDIYAVDVNYAHKMSFPKRIISFIRFGVKAFFLGKKIKDIDLVLTYTPPLTVAYLGKKLADYHQKPFFLEVADAWPEVPIEMGIIRNSLLIKFLKRKTRQIYCAAQHIFPFSDGIKTEIEKYGISPKKITVIYNGADLDRFHLIAKKPKPQTTLIYAGTLGLANEVSQIIHVARKIEEMGRTDLEFIIIGDGNDQKRVAKDFLKNPCKLVKFYESVPREELSEYLEKADIGIVCFAPYPILETNSATKFYDYLSMGLPVIINYQGWQGEYLRQFACGLSAPQNDVNQWVNHILTLVDDADLRRVYGKNARKLAELFDRKKMADQELKLLEAFF